jgi:uroporphyrin-III C-methyltransferase
MSSDASEMPVRVRGGNIRLPVWVVPAVIGAALALAVLGWLWWNTRAEVIELREEVAKRMREASADAREGRTIAKEAQEAVRDSQTRIGALEARLLESQGQQLALEALYQELSRSRDDWLLAEIEQTLAIASQQLQLGGNVPAALVALQNADARLARADRPQFLPLRKILARDIERLKAAPTLDVPGMTLRIDQVIAAADHLPLLADGRPQPEEEPQPAEAAGWERAWRSIWDELKNLVRVQRLDALDASLLAPESRYFLRENLKLRLLHARLALLQRDESAFRADIKAAHGWLNRYFDPREKSVAAASQTLAQLNAAAVAVELPTIADSLTAFRNFKLPRERALQ